MRRPRSTKESSCAGPAIDAPILLLSEQPLDDVARIVEHRLTPTVYTRPYVEALAGRLDGLDGLDVHLKVDTGMGRVGVAPADALALAEIVGRHAPRLRLAGVATHLASADDVTDPATTDQLAAFEAVLATLAGDPGWSTPRTRPAPWRIHTRGTRSSGRGSRCTGSRQGTASIISAASCARR